MKISINDFNFILKSVSENVSVITGDNPITPTDIIHTSSGSVVIGYYNSSSTSIYNYNSSNPANPSTSYLLPTTSNNATFLAMINNSGALQWMSQIDGTYNEESVAVAPGSDGIYLSGRYNSNDVKVYQGALPNALSSYITLPTPSNDAIFLIKYSLNGSIQWATYIDGTSNEYNTAMAVYNDEIYLTGFYESIGTKAYYANPSNQYVELPSFNVYATFLVQYNKFGQVRWATKVENVHPEQNYILTADKNGVYLVGEFNLSDDSPLAYGFPSTGSGYPNVPSVTFSLDATDGFSIFVIRYLNNGVISWMNNMESGSDLYVKDVSADDSSLYILASHIGDSVVVNGTTNYSITIPTSTAVKSFITKYSYNGIVQLAFEPCSDDTQYEINTLMTHDNYLYFGGYFHSSQIAFISYNDARNLTLSGDATYHTGFLARYDKNGKIDWATTQTDPSADINLIELDADSTGIYTVGIYSNQITFNSFNLTDTLTAKSVNNQSVFITRYTQSMPDDFELVDAGNNTILNVSYQADLSESMVQTGSITQVITLDSISPAGTNYRHYFGIQTLTGGTVMNFFFGAYSTSGYQLTNYRSNLVLTIPNCSNRENLNLYQWNGSTIVPSGIFATYAGVDTEIYNLSLTNNNYYGLYDTGNIRPSGGIGSDPYVTTFSGKTYKLKDEIKWYTILNDKKGINIKGHTTGYPEGVYFNQINATIGKSNININFNNKSVKLINSSENPITEKPMTASNFPNSTRQIGNSNGKKNEKLLYIEYQPSFGVYLYINFKQRYVFPIMNYHQYHKQCTGLLCD